MVLTSYRGRESVIDELQGQEVYHRRVAGAGSLLQPSKETIIEELVGQRDYYRRVGVQKSLT